MNLSRSRRPARLLSKREVWAGLADEEPISPEVASANDYWLAHMNANVRNDIRARIIFYLHSRGVTYMEPWMDDELAERVARMQSKAAAMARYALGGGRDHFAPNAFELTELTARFVASLGADDMYLRPSSSKRPAFLGDRDWAVIVYPFTPPLERWQCAPRVVNGVYACDQRLPTAPGVHPPPSYRGWCWCNRYLLIAGDGRHRRRVAR